MADETRQGGQVYKQVAPAGVAPELGADTFLSAEAAAAFGQWLAGSVGGQAARVASLSGLSAQEMDTLLAGQPLFPVDASHVQRLASALAELGLVTHPDAVWQAAGVSNDSDYLVPPGQIVRAVSGN